MPDEEITESADHTGNPVVLSLNEISEGIQAASRPYIGDTITPGTMDRMREAVTQELERVRERQEAAWHPSTRTGRMSASGPNLSNPPTRMEIIDSIAPPIRDEPRFELISLVPIEGYRGNNTANRGGDAFVTSPIPSTGFVHVEHKARDFSAAVQRKLDVQPDRVQSLEMPKPCQGCNEHICMCPTEVRGYYNPPPARMEVSAPMLTGDGPISPIVWDDVMPPTDPPAINPAGEIPLVPSGYSGVTDLLAESISRQIGQAFVDNVIRISNQRSGHANSNSEPGTGTTRAADIPLED